MSAGLLLHRSRDGEVEVLLAHMGGPFWAKKDEHAWTVPKGLRDEGEDDLLAVAEREFAEEMGRPAPAGESLDLGAVKAGRKTNHLFARAADFDATNITSNMFEMEWPRGSGETQDFPEVDRAAWFSLEEARTKLVKGMIPFLDRLESQTREVVERDAGRALVVAANGRVLMIRGEDPNDQERGGFWFTPGGGLDPGESPEQGTIRELHEELGLTIAAVGPLVMHRRDEFPLLGRLYRQRELVFLVEVGDEFEPAPVALEEVESSVMKEFRWLSSDELRALKEPFYPLALADLLDQIRAGGAPPQPWSEGLTDEA